MLKDLKRTVVIFSILSTTVKQRKGLPFYTRILYNIINNTRVVNFVLPTHLCEILLHVLVAVVLYKSTYTLYYVLIFNLYVRVVSVFYPP